MEENCAKTMLGIKMIYINGFTCSCMSVLEYVDDRKCKDEPNRECFRLMFSSSES